MGLCQLACLTSPGSSDTFAPTDLPPSEKKEEAKDLQKGIPAARWRGHERKPTKSDSEPGSPEENNQGAKNPFSSLQMLTFQTRPPSTNCQLLMVLTFPGKVPRVLTFSRRGLLSDCFNSLQTPAGGFLSDRGARLRAAKLAAAPEGHLFSLLFILRLQNGNHTYSYRISLFKWLLEAY